MNPHLAESKPLPQWLADITPIAKPTCPHCHDSLIVLSQTPKWQGQPFLWQCAECGFWMSTPND